MVAGGVPPAHAPLLHVCPLAQALPHVPQFAVSVIRFVQLPVQLVCPVPHAQAPLVQLCPVAQALPHMPQLAALFIRSTHAPEHAVVLPLHVAVHAPFEQTRPVPQVLAQPPQFAGSELVSTHAVLPAHWMVPAAQVHVLLWQDCPVPQACPQVPQLVLSLAVSTHAPPQLSILPEQEEEPPATEELPLEPFPEPLLLIVPSPEPPLLLPLAALSPEPPLPVIPSGVGVDEKDPHEARMTPSDTTSGTDARFRSFFMTTSPIVKGPRDGLELKSPRPPSAAVVESSSPYSEGLHRSGFDRESPFVARKKISKTLNVSRVRRDGFANALGDPRVEVVRQRLLRVSAQ